MVSLPSCEKKKKKFTIWRTTSGSFDHFLERNVGGLNSSPAERMKIRRQTRKSCNLCSLRVFNMRNEAFNEAGSVYLHWKWTAVYSKGPEITQPDASGG